MDIQNLQSDIDAVIEEKITDETFNDAHELYDLLDYDGSIHSIIDSNIDIYNHTLRIWAVDNWEYCEDAISEGLCDGADYHKMIQSGQYKYLYEKASEYIERVHEEKLS